MGEIILVRHGQAAFASDNYDQLTDLGWQQARWLGEHLAAMGTGLGVSRTSLIGPWSRGSGTRGGHDATPVGGGGAGRRAERARP